MSSQFAINVDWFKIQCSLVCRPQDRERPGIRCLRISEMSDTPSVILYTS